MSRAKGTLTFEDGVTLGCVYDGTIDTLLTRLYPDRQTAWDTYARLRDAGALWWNDMRHTCTCGHDEPATVEVDYGGGVSWETRACRHCGAITGRRGPWHHPPEA